MTTDLERQLAGLHQGDHLCLIHEASEPTPALAPFLRAGLARGERCAYIGDERAGAAVLAALGEAGIDIALERERRRLAILTPADLPGGGRHDIETLVAFFRGLVDEALA